MRQARIKIAPSKSDAVYHCTSKTVNGEWLFDEVAKEVLRVQMWRVADYCGVDIATYGILSNHFHLLVHVPQQQPLSDAELLRRYEVMYPQPTKYQTARLEVIKAELSQNGPNAIAWRQRQLALMGDVSQFMKLLKQRFSIWYNKSHGRFGPVWSDRFHSQLLETKEQLLRTIAAYIDLNSVRAGLVIDPKDYRFCGYAEAVAGNRKAQAGILSVTGGRDWIAAQACYREVLFGSGADGRESAASIPLAELQRVVAERGKLPLNTVLRCRIRYFTRGAVLGTRAFVQAQMAVFGRKTSDRGRRAPHPLPEWAHWGDLVTLRGVRQ